jgi:hypothetical protein
MKIHWFLYLRVQWVKVLGALLGKSCGFFEFFLPLGTINYCRAMIDSVTLLEQIA